MSAARLRADTRFIAPSDFYLTRPCPTCSAASLNVAPKRASDPSAESLPFDDLRASWRGFFKERKPFFSYVRCAVCGQLFSPRYFTSSQLDELYRQMDDNTAGQDEALMRRTQLGYWRLLGPSSALVPGDYLEIGPDIGLFTRAATAESALGRFWLIEPNLVVHGALADVVKGKAHTILRDLAELDNVPDGSLSLAVAIHALDHLLEPQPLLELLVRKLAPGGRVLAVTHSEQSLAARIFGVRWPAWCLQHPQLYAPATLRKAFERAGLREVRVRRTTNYFPISYLLQHGLFAFGLGKISVPLPQAWTVGLKLGNIAAIGVRR